MRGRSAELKAGLVVLAASAALLALLYFATGGAFLKSWRRIHLRVEPGALAPHKGDTVFLNGKDIGKVESASLRERVRRGAELTPEDREALAALDPADPAAGDEAAAREIYVLVVAKIEADRVLPAGTKGRITESLTGERNLSLIPGRSLRDLTDEDTAATPIVVEQAIGLQEIGEKASEIAAKAVEVLDEAKLTFIKAREPLEEVRDKVQRLGETLLEGGEIKRTLENVEAATASFRATTSAIEGRIGGITDRLAETVDDFRAMAAGGVRIADGIERDLAVILEEVKSLATRLDGVVERIGPKIEGFVDDAGRVGKNLAALSEDLGATGPTVRRTIEKAGRDVDTLMNLLQDTGQNLADASEDIRAHPWKLLNEPSTDQIAYENLRSTMQNYVRAMQRMDRTSATLRDALRAPGDDPQAKALLARALEQFEASIERYRFFEQRLLELLAAPVPSMGDAPVPGGSRSALPGR